MAVDFQDEDKSGTEKVARNPNNYNILKGGKVDPRSKLYQRSLEGREKLSDYLNRLWNDGGDEADVFMAGVKSLMNRGHGYVGAYLDSKNPGRRYTDNQAKAIVDQVMEDEGIGEHPGARLTRPKAEGDSPEAKEKAKQAKAARKEANVARGSGPQQAPGRKAMPVGQQRKLGKRESTGQPLEDSRREGIGDREKGPVSEWQKTYEDWKKGEASTQDVLAAFQKQYQSKLSGSPQAKEEKQKAKAEDRARETAAPEEAGVTAAPEEAGIPEEGDGKVGVSNEIREALIVPSLRTLFGGRSKENSPGKELENYINDIASGWEGDSDILNGMFDDLSNEISKTYKEQTGVNLDTSSVKNSILETIKRSKNAASKFGTSLEGVQSALETPTPSEQPQPQQAAPGEAKQPPLDRQAQATDEDVMRRATLLGGKKPQAGPEEQVRPERAPDPWEGKPTGPAKDITQEQAPASQQTPTRALPPARSPRPVTSKGGFRVRNQPIRKSGGDGFGGASKPNPKAVEEIMDVAKGKPPIEDFKTFLYNKQGDLFGKTGFDTESSATNPLEGGSTQPFPEGPEETAPASQLPGSGGPTPRSVSRRKGGQQSLFKMKNGQETMEPRSDLKKGSKPGQPASKKRTQAESQQIRKQGAEVLADVQAKNKLAEDMTRRIANSPVAQNKEMRDWINNDLERLLKSFTPAEKTENPWEQDGPEPTGVPEPEAPAQQPQRALPGQPGPKGLLSPGKEPAAPRQGRTNPRGGREENQPAKPSGRRTKAESDDIRQRGQEALEQIQSDARKGKELQQRMADSPAGSGEVPRSQREQELTRRGQQALENEKPKTKKPIRDAVARALIGKGGKRITNSAEYQEFAQSIRAMMR